MSNKPTEGEASPAMESGTIPKTFDEVVTQFCYQQTEFRERLARAGMDRTETMKPTGGHADGQE